MKDELSIPRLNLLHPLVRDTFRGFIEDAETTLGIKLRITQGLRSFAQQNELYAQGRSQIQLSLVGLSFVTAKPTLPRVTNAKGGDSYHNYGLAVDLVNMINGTPDWNYDMELLLPIATKYGIDWGGLWKSIKDRPHFQIIFGKSIGQLLAIYKANDTDEKGYLNIKTAL